MLQVRIPIRVKKVFIRSIFVSLRCSLKYFRASRDLLDLTECPVLISIQTLFFTIMYLEASRKTSASYSHLSTVVASSLQMGLHSTTRHIIKTEKQAERKHSRAYAFASSCVKAAMQVTWLVEQLDNHHLLLHPYWLIVYMSYSLRCFYHVLYRQSG